MSNSVTPPDLLVHGILQARILGWVAIPFSRGSSQPRDRTQVCFIAGRFCNFIYIYICILGWEFGGVCILLLSVDMELYVFTEELLLELMLAS